MNKQGLKVIKFERDLKSQLQYTFVNSYPRSITSMPITYDGSSLLKCSVQMTYMRYVIKNLGSSPSGASIGTAWTETNPFQQSQFNANGLSDLSANLRDIAGVLGTAVMTGPDGIQRDPATGDPI